MSVIAIGVLLVAASTAQAASGANPAAAFSSNGVSASVRAVQPAVSGLFQVHAPRAWVDALDGSGLSGKNGVPDFLDSWDAFSARTSSAILKNGYAFTTIDRLQDEVLYAGVQRASTGGPSSAVLEFSQKPGERTLGDLRISVEIDAAGGVGSVRFETFAGEAKGVSKFLPIAILAGEGCNDAGSACLVANGALLEAGYNLTALGKPEKSFSGIQIRTPEDEVVGTFSAVTLPSATCPSNLTTCTANDVTTTIRDVAIRNNDLCSSLNDTIDLRIRTAFASTSNERYDLGLFVSGDGGTVKEPSTAETCYGAAAQAGEGESGAYPDLDTDLFLDIDTTGHSKTPTTDDTCGDLRASTGPVDWIVDVTVGCNIVSNELRIPSCRVWEQNANHKTSCTSLQQAGTGSKCDCTDLVVTAQLNPCATTICNDDNVCTTDTCEVLGTAPNLTANCVYTPVADGSTPTGCSGSAGECVEAQSCQGGECAGGGFKSVSTACSTDDNICTDDHCSGTSNECLHVNNTNPCSDGDACTTGDVCSSGSCAPGTPVTCADPDQCHTPGTCNPTTGVCSNPAKENGSTCSAGTEGQTPANGGCDAQDTCVDGVCTENLASTGSVCRASACSGDPTCCDLEETCSGTSADCPADAFKASTVICRDSQERCDLPEHCTGDSAFCPGETCEGSP
jgi:hypothetical protein